MSRDALTKAMWLQPLHQAVEGGSASHSFRITQQQVTLQAPWIIYPGFMLYAGKKKVKGRKDSE